MAGFRREPFSDISQGFEERSTVSARGAEEAESTVLTPHTGDGSTTAGIAGGFGIAAGRLIEAERPSAPFRGLLAETVENVIIPRLQLNFGVDISAVIETILAGKPFETSVMASFCRLVVGPDSRDALRFIEVLLERGVSVEAILLNLMAPAARAMGEMWEADLCNFVDVTVGLARIQQMMRQVRPWTFGEGTGSEQKGSIFLAPVPGEQHTFGLRIVEEFLLRDGWDVDCDLRAGVSEIAAAVAEKFYDIIGLTYGGERLLEPLRSAITLARYHSLNRSIKVLVGGVGLTTHSDLRALVEADGFVNDVTDGVILANSWTTKSITQ